MLTVSTGHRNAHIGLNVVADEFNRRLSQTLAWKTPTEVFTQTIAMTARLRPLGKTIFLLGGKGPHQLVRRLGAPQSGADILDPQVAK